jgi:SAM-dependent methyltransferase
MTKPGLGPLAAHIDRGSADWDELAAVDPLYAILSDPTKRGGRWDTDEFLATGVREVESLLEKAGRLGYPTRRSAALDFGCGVGRIARALAGRFDSCVGVDISQTMIDRAQSLNADVPNCSFWVNSTPDLRAFEGQTFDLVYSALVLQHMRSRIEIERFLAEFVRVLAPSGLLVFQLPSWIPLRQRLQPRRRAYPLLRAIGFQASFLQNRLGIYPIQMTAVGLQRITDLLASCGAKVLDVEATMISPFGIESRTYWATRE